MTTMSDSFMSKYGDKWESAGHYFGHRPIQVIGIIIGSVLVIALLAYSSITSTNNSSQLDEVQAAFCNGSATYNTTQQHNCRQLLDQLLKNPTPEQARRLREIVKETP